MSKVIIGLLILVFLVLILLLLCIAILTLALLIFTRKRERGSQTGGFSCRLESWTFKGNLSILESDTKRIRSFEVDP